MAETSPVASTSTAPADPTPPPSSTVRRTAVTAALLTVLAAPLPALAPAAPAAAAPSAWPTVATGSAGAWVARLQRLLATVPVNGRFDRSTRAAVIGFQRSRRLAADGVVGPRTWTALVRHDAARRAARAASAAYLRAHPRLAIGSKGGYVKRLQRALRVTADGYFGPRTRAALVAAQRARRLPPNGVADVRTWRALDRRPARAAAPQARPTPPPAARPQLRLGSRGAWVARLQRSLRVPVDGLFGVSTRSAVVHFQRSRRLPATGVVASRTWPALDRAVRASRGRATPARRPVPPVIACPVAPPRTPADGFGDPRAGGRKHLGADVFSRHGVPVLAAETGVIVRSYSNPLGGLSIILRGSRSRDSYYYAHQSANLVRSGQPVRAGQVIGRVGTSGNAAGTPPHLHFEWWPDGVRASDPYPMLRRACG